MVAWVVGSRESATVHMVMAELAAPVAGRIQLTIDGHEMYLGAIRAALGYRIDYAQLNEGL